ncbi:MAG TPA: PEGA domain-containing protein, partial [Kofleriaceae bacterium]
AAPVAPDAAVRVEVRPDAAVAGKIVKHDRPKRDKHDKQVREPVSHPPPPPPPAEVKPGMLSIDSTPYATIYVDGQRLDQTPIVGKSIPAGKHKIKAVTKDGRTQFLNVEIQPGKLANAGTLTW